MIDNKRKDKYTSKKNDLSSDDNDNSIDSPIIATADDAILAKLSTSLYGYYEDPFLPHMAQLASGLTSSSPKSSSSLSVKTHPIIRKGTHARVCVMDRSISAFLSLHADTYSKKQVVILGAGKDTTYLRYQEGLLQSSPLNDVSISQQNELRIDEAHEATSSSLINEEAVKWYEIDYPKVIRSKRILLHSIPSHKEFESEKKRSTIHLVPFDLRFSTQDLFDILIQEYSFSLQIPTLFVSECVQMYLPENSSREILSTITQKCKTSIVALYDPLASDNTPFGKTMQRNLLSSNAITHQSSMMKNKTLSQHMQKLCDCGFDMAIGCNMMDAYETILTKEQRWKANMSEMLDEVEEWRLIMQHYCFVVGGQSSCDHLNGQEFVKSFCQVGEKSILGFKKGKCQILRKNGTVQS